MNAEINTAACRLVVEATTLKLNENSGCPTSGDQLEALMPRINRLAQYIATLEGQEVTNFVRCAFSTNYGLSNQRFVADSLKSYLLGQASYF